MLSDLRQALRQLLKAPGFTFTVVVTLALGIGATTAIFTLVQQVMLKSLPVVKPQELYRIGDKIHCCNWGGYTQDGEFSLFSWELYKHFRDHTPAFEQLAALQGGNAPLGVRRAGTSQQAETRNGEYVSGNFFQTFGVGARSVGNRVVMGRPITDEDTASTRNVAVINEAFAKKFFKGENPIGRHFGPGQTKYSSMFEVIGVDTNMRYITYGLKDPVRPMFFLPEAQSTHFATPSENAGELWSHYLYNIVLWAPGNPQGLEAQVRKAVGEIDPNLVLYSVDSYAHVLGGDFAQQNMIATLTMLFGALGLVLAAVGLYGVTAYTVEQRTNEIGVRMALGADRGNVVSMILRGAFWQVGVGLALGIPAAVGAGWAITTQLFGVKFWDPATLSMATVLLALAALAAALIPAHRAASLDPMQALRTE